MNERPITWPTAAQATDLIAEELARTPAQGQPSPNGQALRWLLACVNALPKARAAGPDVLEATLAEPVRHIDLRWEALLAGAIRYRLRTMGLPQSEMPAWTAKEPLKTLWFVGPAVGPRLAASSIALAPPELRRLGIMLPAVALGEPL